VHYFDGEAFWKTSLGKPRSILGYNVKMDRRDIGYVAGRWKEAAQGCVRWWGLLLAVLNLRFLLPESWLLYVQCPEFSSGI